MSNSQDREFSALLLGDSIMYKVMVGALWVLAAYAGLVALPHAIINFTGGDIYLWDARLKTMEQTTYICVTLIGIVGIFWIPIATITRWVGNNFKLSWMVVSAPLAIIIIAQALVYAHLSEANRLKRNVEATIQAVKQKDDKKLLDILLRCQRFCGFDRDTGALIWLTGKAHTPIEYQAIGRMLMGEQRAPLDGRSDWYSDRRTALEIAIDRHAERSGLMSHLLDAAQPVHWKEKDSALIYAAKKRASMRVIDILLKSGADPHSIINGMSAIDAARSVQYDEALAAFDKIPFAAKAR